jgi:hypothetical protein
LRWVSGSCAAAAAPIAALIPGTTFAAAPEDERIAALQPDDFAPGQRLAHQERVDCVLRHSVARTLLGHRDELGPDGNQRENRRIDQPVVDDQFGLAQQPCGAHRQQVGIARTGTDQPDFSGS